MTSKSPGSTVFLLSAPTIGAADHKAAIEHLAQQYPFMDLTRVGVVGGSYGGYGSLHAALLFPDFFKVCVSADGTHDWLASGFPEGVEHLFGIPGQDIDYDAFSNTRLADRLRGKVMLIQGELDEHVHSHQAFLMADAFMKAGKDYEMLLVPNADHWAFFIPSVTRRWQHYFVEHLGGPVDD